MVYAVRIRGEGEWKFYHVLYYAFNIAYTVLLSHLSLSENPLQKNIFHPNPLKVTIIESESVKHNNCPIPLYRALREERSVHHHLTTFQ